MDELDEKEKRKMVFEIDIQIDRKSECVPELSGEGRGQDSRSALTGTTTFAFQEVV